MGLGEIWPESERLLELCHGLVELALLLEDVPRLLCASARVGLESQRLLELGRGFVELALVVEDVAQVVVRLGIDPGLRAIACSIPCQGLVELALLPEDVAQVVVRLGRGRA